MSKIIPKLKYRAQGREGADAPLTRRQEKALRQHNAATAGRIKQLSGYKAKVTQPVFWSEEHGLFLNKEPK